jgi:hypothetical protein
VWLQATYEVGETASCQEYILKPLQLLRELPLPAQIQVVANFWGQVRPLEELVVRPRGAAVVASHENMPDIRLGAEQPEHPPQRFASQGDDVWGAVDQISRLGDLVVLKAVKAVDDSERPRKWLARAS